MKGQLQGFGLLKHPFRNGILVTVSNVGKTHGFQLSAGALLVAKNASFAGFPGILIGGNGPLRQDTAD